MKAVRGIILPEISFNTGNPFKTASNFATRGTYLVCLKTSIPNAYCKINIWGN